VVCPTPAQQLVFQAYGRAVNEHTARLQRLEQARRAPAGTWRVHPVVEALQALRGVPCTVAVTTGAARGDLTRVDPPRHLMDDRGLTPSAYSRGERRRQGSLPKAGTTHARRARMEGSWAYRYPATGSRHLQRRLETPPHIIQDISRKAQVRRCKRSRPLSARGTNANLVVVAMARE
jgi:transposase